jgi:predicted AAA+ superfamily ATPase
LYFSPHVKSAYEKLKSLKADVNQYWSQVNRYDIQKYLSYGSLPFSSLMPTETSIYDAINMLIDKIIQSDLEFGRFDPNTLGMVKRILFAIAEHDVTSLSKLEKVFQMNRITLSHIFDALEKAEILIKVPSYGANMTIAKKPHKYLFMSSAVRMSFFYFTGMENTYLVRQGKLLEDSVGLHLYQEFLIKGLGAIRYDSEEGGADFILQIANNKQILMEVGLGNKDKKQIIQSSKKISSHYNIIFSNTPLALDSDHNIIFVPLDYYFLM